jgi:hypothetical protein
MNTFCATTLKTFVFGGWSFWLISCAAAVPLNAAESDLQERIASRDFPSVFQAWNPATRLAGKSEEEMTALHDLYFTGPGQLGLKWVGKHEGEGTDFTPGSLLTASRKIAELRRLNPQLLILVEVRYRDAPPDFFSADSPYWLRDEAGRPVIGWKEGGYFKIDIHHTATRDLEARRARALVKTGLIDGVMLDWWSDDPDRLDLIRAIRNAVGNKLILVNGNDHTFPLTAPFANGTYMECTQTNTPEDWARISSTLRWAEQHTRAPRINCLETWFHRSRQDFDLMRATTTLALTQSDGYCLFCDPDPLPTPDHLHDWYPFWAKGLGRPLSVGVEQPDKSWRREFTNGTVIYNPMGNAPVTVRFEQLYLSRATGKVAQEHQIPPSDGDILIRQKS